MDILKFPHIYMKDEAAVVEKITTIASEGVDKLQFVTDFDATVTKQHENGVLTMIAFEVFFYKCKQLPISTLERIAAIRSKNGPIESDLTIAMDRKVAAMEEIYSEIHKSLRGFEFNRQEIEEVVRKYGSPFRDRTDELFSKLKDLNVPVTVFSAGLGDVIKAHLQKEGVLYNNVNLIANFLKFNGSILDGLDNHEHLIHPFNKHEHFNRYQVSNDRKNIILMGDNIGDVSVVSDLKNKGTILKIGFFYNQTDEGLETFKETFDIVLKDDQTMNVILNIVKLLE